MGKEQKKTTGLSCPLGKPECTVNKDFQALQCEIEVLKRQVITDSLTGLFNAAHMKFSISQEMERARRHKQPVTFILLDVDHFKKFNDTYGHIVGDRVLQHIARILRKATRQIDLSCRYGGEEFGVILPASSLLVGTQVAERIRAMIASTPLIDNERELHITVSAGVDAFTQRQRDSVDEFIARTDKQLYRAKENGRNRVEFPRESDGDNEQSSVTLSEKEALFKPVNNEKK